MNVNEQLAALGFSITVRNICATIDPGWGDGQLVIHSQVSLFQSEEGIEVMTTPYTQGIGHYPVLSKYNASNPMDVKKIRRLFEQGLVRANVDLSDILYSLLMEATDESFEDWASEFGMDTDSRKAERMWVACCATHKALYDNVLSTTLEEARTILEDY